MCYTTACFRVGSSSGVVYYCHFISPCVNDDVILVDATQVASELLSDACRDQRWEIPVKLHYSTMLLYLSLGVGTVEYLKDRFDFFDFFYLSALMLMGKKRGGGATEIVPVGAAWMVTKATCRVFLTDLGDFLAAFPQGCFGNILQVPFGCNEGTKDHWSFKSSSFLKPQISVKTGPFLPYWPFGNWGISMFSAIKTSMLH